MLQPGLALSVRRKVKERANVLCSQVRGVSGQLLDLARGSMYINHAHGVGPVAAVDAIGRGMSLTGLQFWDPSVHLLLCPSGEFMARPQQYDAGRVRIVPGKQLRRVFLG